MMTLATPRIHTIIWVRFDARSSHPVACERVSEEEATRPLYVGDSLCDPGFERRHYGR